MIAAGWSELEKAFRKHTGVAGNNDSSSHYLLKFYAVECGLKAIYLRRNNLNTTERISDERLRQSHDLAEFVKKLKLPAAVTQTNSNFRLRRDKSSWSVDKLHQAWRYGILIDGSDEQKLIDWLDHVHKWIQENI